jgi:TatD DNase family protein
MHLIDTHAHIYADAFQSEQREMIQRSIEKGVNDIIMPNIDQSSWSDAVEMEKQFPENCHLCIGLHPCSVKENYEAELTFFENRLHERPFAAIGESGIDLYWDKSTFEEQVVSFDRQISWAKDLDIPVIIHSRDSLDETIRIVEERQDGRLIPVFHCFNGTLEQGRRIEDVGGFMGIGGVLTYKNAGLKPIIAQLTIERLLLETDAPYLPPVPHRGKRNEPAYIRLVLSHLCEIFDMPESDMAAITTRNAKQVFNKYLKYKYLSRKIE